MLAIIIEREPLRLEDLPAALQSWVLTVGGFAAVCLAIWYVLRLSRRDAGRSAGVTAWGSRLLAIAIGGLFLMLLPPALRVLWNRLGWVDESMPTFGRAAWYQPFLDLRLRPPRDLAVEFGAACAAVAVFLPVLANFARLRWRRIGALARLSFKDAIRRRVLWIFSILLLLFLFATWFLPSKPEEQVRGYVGTVFWVMTVLLLVTGGLLASFSIPADIKGQTIHTIVTKPVERFEIILGRFLGYTALMTTVLAVMSLFCLIYVARGVNEEAAQESLKAREPIYGNLLVTNPKNVGYEWDYRKYITGAVADEEAIWTYPRLPISMATKTDPVRCEFTFDIFRTTKGEEDKGINATFIFKNWEWRPSQLDEYHREQNRLLRAPHPDIDDRAREERWPLERKLAVLYDGLAEKYGYYELPSKEVVDFHTLSVEVPAGLFRKLPEWEQLRGQRPAALQTVVRCESATQYLGVAKHDLYLLPGEGGGADLRGFAINFFKGTVGLWYRLCLIIGVAVTCSTYLSGVISFLTAMVIYVPGLFLDFIRTVAKGESIGGGPLENALRLVQGINYVTPLDATPVYQAIAKADKGFEFAIGWLMQIVPDVDRFDLTNWVAEGFNISSMQLLLAGILLAGYLLPWLVLAFHLIRSREVAA